jgi:hypothetical protein
MIGNFSRGFLCLGISERKLSFNHMYPGTMWWTDVNDCSMLRLFVSTQNRVPISNVFTTHPDFMGLGTSLVQVLWNWLDSIELLISQLTCEVWRDSSMASHVSLPSISWECLPTCSCWEGDYCCWAVSECWKKIKGLSWGDFRTNLVWSPGSPLLLVIFLLFLDGCATVPLKYVEIIQRPSRWTRLGDGECRQQGEHCPDELWGICVIWVWACVDRQRQRVCKVDPTYIKAVQNWFNTTKVHWDTVFF